MSNNRNYYKNRKEQSNPRIDARVKDQNIKFTLSEIKKIMGDYHKWEYFKKRNDVNNYDEELLPDMKINEEESNNIRIAKILDFVIYSNTEFEDRDLRVSFVSCYAYFVPYDEKIQYRINYIYDIYVTDKSTIAIKGNYKERYLRNDDMPLGRDYYGYGYYGRKYLKKSQYEEITDTYFDTLQSESEILEIINNSSANNIGIQEIMAKNQAMTMFDVNLKEYEYIITWGKNHEVKNFINRINILQAILMGKLLIRDSKTEKNMLNLPENILDAAEEYESGAYNMLKIMHSMSQLDKTIESLSKEELSELTNTILKNDIDVEDFTYIRSRMNYSLEKLVDVIKNTQLNQGYTKKNWVKTWVELLKMTGI